MTKVLAHYYVDRKHNPYSAFRKRLAVETKEIPEPGDLLLIKPEWMAMNESRMGCGIYEVLFILPNKDNENPIYDYSPYKSWFDLVLMKAVIVKPLLVMTNSEFNNSEFNSIQEVSNSGIIKNKILVTNTITGELREVE